MINWQFNKIYLGLLKDITARSKREVGFDLDINAKIISVDISDKNHVRCLVFYPSYSSEDPPVERKYRHIRIGFISTGENVYDSFNLGHDDDILYLNSLLGWHVIVITDEVKGLIHG